MKRGFCGAVAAVWLCAAAVAAQGGILFCINDNTDSLERIDTNTLVRTIVGPLGTPFSFGGLAWDGTTLFMIAGRSNNNLYRVNTTTGAATLVGLHGLNDLFGLEFDPITQKLFASQFVAGTGLFTLNRTTGAATTINPAMSEGLGGLAFDTKRNMLVGIRDGSGTLYQINESNGALTLLASPGATNDSGLAYDPEKDVFWDIDYNGNLFKCDPNTGYARSTVLSGLGAHDALAFVPEPGSLGVLAAWALVVAGGCRRGRRCSAAC
jgi:hypothetical protein